MFQSLDCSYSELDNGSIPRIDGFSIVRRDRTRHGGGVAIYVSNDIHFTGRQHIESEALENVWIELKYNRRSLILVGAFYRPPSANSDFFDKFDMVLATASTENKECVLLGDFNCNFIDGVSNANTDEYYCCYFGKNVLYFSTNSWSM